MRILACSLALGLAAAPVHARPPTAGAPPAAPVTEAEKVNAAIQAWSSGNWARVRALLEPMVQDGRKPAEWTHEEAALRFLADATLQDPEIAAVSNEWATAYIKRLLASSPDWRPPADTHSKAFYDLYSALREERDRAAANQCKGERAACIADLDELKVRHDALGKDHELLRRAYAQQEVEVVEKVARNRAAALVPFGVGHFYNGRKNLGAAFLAGELALGATALGLFIARVSRCERLRGYQAGSLYCTIGTEQGLALRNAEQTMGILFLGALALDVVLAQALFRPFATVKRTRVRRSELSGAEGDAAAREKKPAKGPADRPGARPARLRSRDILQVTPASTLVPGGGGFGVKIRF